MGWGGMGAGGWGDRKHVLRGKVAPQAEAQIRCWHRRCDVQAAGEQRRTRPSTGAGCRTQQPLLAHLPAGLGAGTVFRVTWVMPTPQARLDMADSTGWPGATSSNLQGRTFHMANCGWLQHKAGTCLPVPWRWASCELAYSPRPASRPAARAWHVRDAWPLDRQAQLQPAAEPAWLTCGCDWKSRTATCWH